MDDTPTLATEGAPAPDPMRALFPNSAGMFEGQPAPTRTPAGDPHQAQFPRSPGMFPNHAGAAEQDPLRAQFPNSPGMWQQPKAAEASSPAAVQPAAPALPAEAGAFPAAYEGVVVPEGHELDRAAFAPVARELARAGYSREQVEIGLQQHAAFERQRVEAEDRAFAVADAGWRKEAEAALEADPGVRAAFTAAAKTVPQDVRRLLEVAGLANHPALVGWLAGIGRRLGQ